ncbi:hypothetical protein C2E23DRAFT_863884 [Lenzites betulinus]|nr:hypothetical protein C2E23DRAFT_863884 [Lenzites betulinus]
MPRVDPELIKDWDTLAASIGKTPKLDQEGEIVSIGATGPKGKTYVVWVGRAVGLFKNWGLTSAMVTAFPGAIYKSFKTCEEARAAWYEGPTKHLPGWKPPPPRSARPTPQSHAAAKQSEAQAEEGALTASPLVTATDVHVLLPPQAMEDPEADADVDDAFLPCATTPSRTSSISSVSSISEWSDTVDETMRPRPSVLTADTLSLYSALSPAMSELNLHGLSPSTPRRAKHGARSPSPPPSPTTPASMRRLTRKRQAQGSRDMQPEPKGVHVRKGDVVFVVIRGDRPGIYFDRTSALLNAGWNPGMKIVAFTSLSQAAWYFVQKYMQQKVGVPVIEVFSDDNGEGL